MPLTFEPSDSLVNNPPTAHFAIIRTTRLRPLMRFALPCPLELTRALSGGLDTMRIRVC